MRKLSAIVFALAGVLVSVDVHATTRDLCTSVPGECEYTGPDAPVLAANVCWFRSTSTAKLMTGATCPTGGWPYFVKYGVVDSLTLEVTGYVPLEDACVRYGLCLPGYLAPPTTWAQYICCYDGVCWPANGTWCEGYDLAFCSDGVTNEDGTVTCFEE